uniref:Dynamin-type G domain-containing protein n=1 Tax=Aureoumbra lagunensis TaxID=44058 RepID=A0A7S3NN86_9STRA|mmetsp:Transcript_3895/g.5446  ORF Transcript_3895/g.5446 Transcript_3895/m.5446 type:complete len:506 (+) Transcript_3895:51-1568(+)|eukprot:CAMPEP_0197315556 /NCGR_PEP_ID=MMETSP0891-20130614/38752_1 /TAXON_ID=44058 ORGANISM="Aureoumbra lagunensis, Strain CCMP1510" /NCGR_SAMPLE_ID=MMETSP0891 /ASSEMBLY_ACC=CAM_ASM_000534 /LENGTH=505 /DNA_ID=CAMNT_0042804567 /DNA_START=10 /DNA_END=1527 /DNA_ORIENTATION=-
MMIVVLLLRSVQPAEISPLGRLQPIPRREEIKIEDKISKDESLDLRDIDKEYFYYELKKLYKRKMLPLELSSQFGHFASPPLGPADFDAKPMVLLLGQYSVGKTSFIRSLIGRDFPGQRIGPEPTTDRFVAVMHGDQDRSIPGNALAMRSDKPFAGLQGFGNRFLEKFQGAELDVPILQNITLIDTPGILSGEKQRIGRDYDFQTVVQWFAERSDLIILMFDAHKLDISDELRLAIDALRPHYTKVRVLLNKADTISPQQLLRVYGALMWQLGRVMATPEVVRVHLGAFSKSNENFFNAYGQPQYTPDSYQSRAYYPNQPVQQNSFAHLLITERHDLLEELRLLPANAVLRKINDLSKRGRFLKVHCFLIHFLRKQMPYFFAKEDKRRQLMQNLHHEFAACAHRYGLSLGDFPNVDHFRTALGQVKDLRAFPKLDKSQVVEMDRMFAHDISKLLDKASSSKKLNKKVSSSFIPPPPATFQHQHLPPQQPPQHHNPLNLQHFDGER